MSSTGLSACCISGTVNSGTPKGKEIRLGGLDSYIVEGKDSSSSAGAIVMLTDIFGWKLNNARLIADMYADQGNFTVYIPDVFQGDSLPESFLDNVEPPLSKRAELTLVEKTKNAAIVPATLGPWLLKHREGVVTPLINNFLIAVKAATSNGKVGALGFCWGGRYAILHAHGDKSNNGETESVGVDAAFACHPSLLAVPADIDPVSKPTALAVGTEDSLLDMDSVKKIEGILSSKSVPTEVKVYQDQIHGFAIRSDWSSEKDKKSMDEATQQGVAWFKKYLS